MKNQKRLKFAHQSNAEFMKELRDSVKNYFESNNISQYGNGKIILKSIIMLSFYFTPYVLMITGVISSFNWIFASWILMGIAVAGIGMGVMHDANHSSYSNNKKLNFWMGNTLLLLGGFPHNWRHQHNILHHMYTNIEGHDEDISPVGILRISPHKPAKKFHRFQHLYAWFFYGLMTLLWVTTKDFQQFYRYTKSGATLSNNKSHTQLLTFLIFSKIFYYSLFLLVPILVLPVSWYWVVIFFLSMHFTAGFILTVIFQTAHVVPSSEYPLPDEDAVIENNWTVHQLLTTSDFSPNNRLLTWYIGGLNYQVEHHLFPNISHIHYPKIAHIVRNTAEKYNIPYHVQPGFIRAVWEHAKMLKTLGRA